MIHKPNLYSVVSNVVSRGNSVGTTRIEIRLQIIAKPVVFRLYSICIPFFKVHCEGFIKESPYYRWIHLLIQIL